MSDVYHLKPQRTGWVWFHLGLIILIIFPITAALYIAFGQSYIPMGIIAAILSGITILTWLVLEVSYRKEQYEIYPDRIIRKRGGIFWSSQTQLIITNITHIGYVLPFLEYNIAKTGSVFIEAAGSAKTEVQLKHVSNPVELYEMVQDHMRNQGFSLQRTTLKDTQTPSTLGCAIKAIGSVLGFVVLWAFIIVSIAGDGLIRRFSSFIPVLSVILISVIIFVIILTSIGIIRFLNLKKRIYQVYDDSIYYQKHFMTHIKAVIPAENISDAHVKQSFLEQLLGLYNVTVSCQGSGEIEFSIIHNGEQFKQAIDTASEFKSTIQSKSTLNNTKKVDTQSNLNKHRIQQLSADTSTTGTYKMHFMRTILGPLINIGVIVLIIIILSILSVLLGFFEFTSIIIISLAPWLFIAGLISVITSTIQATQTVFRVKPQSVEMHYVFLTRKTAEFSIEKITGIVIKQHIVDRLFGTCTIDFWSIGANESISFYNVPKDQTIIDLVLGKIGIQPQQTPMTTTTPDFSLKAFLIANIGSLITGILIISGALFFARDILTAPLLTLGIILLIVVCAGIVIYKKAYYNRVSLNLHNGFLHAKQGLIIYHDYYTQLQSVKDIISLQLPIITCGHLTFNIAGEHVVDQGRNQVSLSNSFTIHYLNNPQDIHDTFDSSLHKQQLQRDDILYRKPAIANSVTKLIVASIIITPLVILLPITLPWTIIRIRVKKFSIQQDRILSMSGILFQRRITILFDRIDHLSTTQGPINKLYKNGTIHVFTAGSRRPEMFITNIPEVYEFEQEIDKRYK